MRAKCGMNAALLTATVDPLLPAPELRILYAVPSGQNMDTRPHPAPKMVTNWFNENNI